MTITDVVYRARPAHRAPTVAPKPAFEWARAATGAVGLIGAATLAYGVLLPWLSTYNGLPGQNGWGTRNGTLLLISAGSAALLALSLIIWESAMLRWALAMTGFATAGFVGWLLIQFDSVFGQLDGTTSAGKGPGLYVAAGGAMAVFATVFLPVSATPQKEATAPARVASRRGSASPLAALLRPIGSRWRFPAAGLAVAAGLAHVPVTPEHLQEAPYIGQLFIALTVVCILGATMLLISDNALTWLVVGDSCLLAVIAYLVSRTFGLPLMSDDIGNWFEPLGIVSVATESGVAVLALAALRRLRTPPPAT
jgi:hypothetical protein